MRKTAREWWGGGAPWIWLSAGAVSIAIVLTVGLILLIAVRGLAHFWPATVTSYVALDRAGTEVRLMGQVRETETIPAEQVRDAGYTLPTDRLQVERRLLKTGNRDVLGTDFRWLLEPAIQQTSQPNDAMVLERREWGDFVGFLTAVKQGVEVVASGDGAKKALQGRLDRALELFSRIRELETDDIGRINYRLERLRLESRRLALKDELTAAEAGRIAETEEQLQAEYAVLEAELGELYQQINRDSLIARTIDGAEVTIPLAKVVRAYWPNQMGLVDKIGFYAAKLWEFVSAEPREANTEGGIFPAIYGTVLMVMLMSVLVTPFGVVAAVYLREYAHQGILVRTIRIAVNNLAGVPSIVYGVFGLGFFVYAIGGTIDQLFYPEALPAPTFGTGGLLWASLTLALLTLPVVIVSTEEGLSRIPRAIREGSLALGATKAETLWRTVLPMASPAIMTGVILAVARAAGEVAPLMLVGVVKLAPALPLDGNFPFLHADRKFMHLGFHIYDVGFQSPNVEAARPLVYATALLLIIVILLLNIVAIRVRNNLREKYRALET